MFTENEKSRLAGGSYLPEAEVEKRPLPTMSRHLESAMSRLLSFLT